MRRSSKHSKGSFLQRHSLSLVSIALLAFWFGTYCVSDPATHLGAFFGNAIADWTGSVVIIIGTKFLYEVGSAESRPVRRHLHNRGLELLREHSLLLFLLVTGLGWLLVYLRVDPESKWGQVVGNILSEWVQMGGLVFFTKGLVERGSKESR